MSITVRPGAKIVSLKEEEMKVIEAMEGFKFGCDPELFVFDPEGRPVPADMIPGTKEEPYAVEGGAVQRDGMAAEFNITPVTTFRDFNKNIEVVMKQLESFLPKGYSLRAVPSVTFDPHVFDSAEDKSKELGCMPDFNAWTGEINPPPHNPEQPYLRTASGHIHIGWTEDTDLTEPQHVINCRDLVKQLDWFLGAWSVGVDSDPTRRTLYGRAGACRFKDYGVEYRVLSNFWVTSRDRRMAVWNRLQLAISTMAMDFIADKVPNSYSETLQNCINSSRIPRDFSSTFNYPIRTLDQSSRRF